MGDGAIPQYFGGILRQAPTILSATRRVFKYTTTVAATIEGKMFKTKYRFKRVKLAWHHQNRLKRKLVLFLRFSLQSNFRSVLPPPQGEGSLDECLRREGNQPDVHERLYGDIVRLTGRKEWVCFLHLPRFVARAMFS